MEHMSEEAMSEFIDTTTKHIHHDHNTDLESCIADGLNSLRNDLIRLYFEKDVERVKLGKITINQLIAMLQKKQNTLKASLYKMATGEDIGNPDDYLTNDLVDRVDNGIVGTTAGLYSLRESVAPDLTKRPVREYLGTEEMPKKIDEIKEVLTVEKGRIDELTEKKMYIVKPEYKQPLATYVDNMRDAVNDSYTAGRKGRCLEKKFPRLTDGENASVGDLHRMLDIYKKCDSCHCKYIGECKNRRKDYSKCDSKHDSKHNRPVIKKSCGRVVV
ncbi:hypothetical protein YASMINEVIRUS_562 [Yasminevirus sp. GU-2018]|uniref:Uncharacterized protein n=1 Tax=Yasminevirus sp. GU-2018 TaxID=2420051 RepID=A0A5K0U7S6_9VIRU|nr:hypothetical protein YASMINEVIRUS_562 [Yasminevirus sp. GU-2018]